MTVKRSYAVTAIPLLAQQRLHTCSWAVMARQHAKKLSAGTHVIRRSLKDGACRSLEASSALRGIARKDANARQGLGVSVRPAKKLRAGTRLIRRSLRDGAYHAPQPRAYSSLGGCGELIERGSGGGEKLAQKLFAGKRTIRRSLKDGACAYRSVEACGKRRFKELGDAGAGRGSEAHGTPVMARRHARKLSAGTRMIRRNLRERAYRSLNKARGELGGSGRGQWSEAHERPEKRLRAGTRMMRRNLREGAYRSLEACSVPRKLGDAGEGQGSEAHERPAKRLRAGTRMMRRNLRKGVYSSFEAGDMLTSNSALCEDVDAGEQAEEGTRTVVKRPVKRVKWTQVLRENIDAQMRLAKVLPEEGTVWHVTSINPYTGFTKDQDGGASVRPESEGMICAVCCGGVCCGREKSGRGHWCSDYPSDLSSRQGFQAQQAGRGQA